MGKNDGHYSKPYRTDRLYSENMRKKGQPPTLAAPTKEDAIKRLEIIRDIEKMFRYYKISNVNFEGNATDGGHAIEIEAKENKGSIMYV